MRVNQSIERIGRFYPLGERFESIRIVDPHYHRTFEKEACLALSGRIKLFEGMVGRLQLILSAISREISALAVACERERGRGLDSSVHHRRGGIGDQKIAGHCWRSSAKAEPRENS